jgi:hypothetical protein
MRDGVTCRLKTDKGQDVSFSKSVSRIGSTAPEPALLQLSLVCGSESENMCAGTLVTVMCLFKAADITLLCMQDHSQLNHVCSKRVCSGSGINAGLFYIVREPTYTCPILSSAGIVHFGNDTSVARSDFFVTPATLAYLQIPNV